MSGEHYTYLIINLASISIPLAASFEHRIRFFSQWKYWLVAIAVPGILFIIWDAFFTQWGIWGFNDRYITGLSLLGLPMEEWLFFFCIPYACLFTYEALKYLISYEPTPQNTSRITYVLGAILLVVAVLNYDKAYTATTFLLLFMALLAHEIIITKSYLGRFYLTYLFILVPFFIVNGILTGSFIEEEVVWYNDLENLGIRMFTIPVEDTFYGMLLILLNVTIFEYLKNSNKYQQADIVDH